MVWRALRIGRLGPRGGTGSQPTIGNWQVEACPLPVCDGGLAVAGWRRAFPAPSMLIGRGVAGCQCRGSLGLTHQNYSGILRGTEIDSDVKDVELLA